jgi:RNA polymerase subunit RPABC4/transcription elongation factor Spt4
MRKRPCLDCHELVPHTRSRCPTHAAQQSAAARGYDSKWSAYSLWFRTRHPLCGDAEPDAYPSTASLCKAQRRTTPVLGYTLTANGRRAPNGAVHHIHGHDGPDDPALYDPRNLESLCAKCHGITTRANDWNH